MEKEILKAEKQGGARRITWHCRRAAFAALTPPPTDTLGSAVACGSAWSLGDMPWRCSGNKKQDGTQI